MATAASLYSSSPPTVPTPQNPSHSVSCSSHDIEFYPRSLANHQPVSRPLIGGLSLLFGNPASRSSSCSSNDSIDASSLPRRSSQTDLCALLDGNESWSDAVSISAPASSKIRERSIGQGSGRSIAVPQDRTSSRASVQEQHHFSPSELDFTFSFVNRSPMLSGLDTYTEIPGSPRLMKLECSSLSEFFCKPLFPETLRTSQDVLHIAQRRHEIFKDPFIIRAFEEAEQAHHGQFRANGDLYLVHCVETAMVLANIGANKVVVAAGLLHDTIDDSCIKYTQLQELFGTEVANLVEGVTRVSEFSKLARDNHTAYKTVEADRLHTMILAMADVRVVLIKLADRLHNMRTLGALRKDKRCRIAKETLEVFVPLAGRLGIWSWKSEMEDLCFKHLKPHEHRELAIKLAEGFREATILSAIQKLDQALLGRGVQYYDLCGRPKNLFSIHKKMIRKRRKVDEIYDVQGLRLIVANEEDCYAALEIAHQLWPCVPGKLKDYISQPKMNGYQSLHTVVWGDDGLPLEIQIRTKDMHHQAEFGVAAHWRYKEGNIPHTSFVLQMVEWARWVLTWQNEIIDTKLRLSRLDGDIRPPCPFPFHNDDCRFTDLSHGAPHYEDGPLLVITLEEDKMTVQEMPGGSTIADLLQRSANEGSLVATPGIGFGEELRPKVNHKVIKDINQRLKMGDLIDMTPCIQRKCLNEYREQLKRLFEDYPIQEELRKPLWGRVSEIAVF